LKNKQILFNRDVEVPSVVYFSVSLYCRRHAKFENANA
jgi:hypothetical protein